METMSRTVGGWLRLIAGAAIIGWLIWHLGTGPFLDGLRTVNAWSVLAAVAIAVPTTICAAWRWTIVARGLGVALSLRTAVAASYRAQFLNTALPDAGDLSHALRAVAWERIAGQVVQAVIVVVVLCALPSPLHSAMPVVVAVAVAVLVLLLVVGGLVARSRSGRSPRVLRGAVSDVRRGLLARDAWPGVLFASVIVVAGHLATFLVAARTAGATVSTERLVPLALLALLAAAVPTNIGGWGPREGVAACAFGAAGLGAAQGLAVSTVFGVLVIASTLPGAVVLVADRRRPANREPRPAVRISRSRAPIPAGGPAHG
jgi:glycosyltransferase 2 family protein